MQTRGSLATLAAAALLAGTLGVSVAAGADGAETTGTMVLTQTTTLTADHAGNIRIKADGVTLDCAGHTVHGPGIVAPGAEGFSGGIDFANLHDVTIRDCVVTGFQYNGVFGSGAVTLRVEGNTFVANANHGLHLDFASDSIIVGNSATNNGTANPAIGIVLTRSTGVTLQGNVLSGNKWAGLALLDGTHGSLVTGNRATQNGSGILVEASNANVLSANTANVNGQGFFVRQSSENLLSANIANGNSFAGFWLERRSSSNTLARNVANGNRDGFNIIGSSGNILSWDSARNNHSYGLTLSSGSSANTITYCTAIGNGTYDAHRDGTGTGNVWYRNTFGTKAGL